MLVTGLALVFAPLAFLVPGVALIALAAWLLAPGAKE